jgi:hypothetical protein
MRITDAFSGQGGARHRIAAGPRQADVRAHPHRRPPDRAGCAGRAFEHLSLRWRQGAQWVGPERRRLLGEIADDQRLKARWDANWRFAYGPRPADPTVGQRFTMRLPVASSDCRRLLSLVGGRCGKARALDKAVEASLQLDLGHAFPISVTASGSAVVEPQAPRTWTLHPGGSGGTLALECVVRWLGHGVGFGLRPGGGERRLHRWVPYARGGPAVAQQRVDQRHHLQRGGAVRRPGDRCPTPGVGSVVSVSDERGRFAPAPAPAGPPARSACRSAAAPRRPAR